MFVFAYASLLSPNSLAATLPGVDPSACVPAWCDGYTRTFSVGFPNSGSEPDKEYRDTSGHRPPIVRFCDLAPAPGSRVNGICIPVDDDALTRLRRRERRYDEIAVRHLTRMYANESMFDVEVVAFIGKPRYRTVPGDAGVVPADYLGTALAGAHHWNNVVPGFLEDFHHSTILPAPAEIVPLTRIDHPADDADRAAG